MHTEFLITPSQRHLLEMIKAGISLEGIASEFEITPDTASLQRRSLFMWLSSLSSTDERIDRIPSEEELLEIRRLHQEAAPDTPLPPNDADRYQRFFQRLGADREGTVCCQPDCHARCLRFSRLCRSHCYELAVGRPCPFGDT